MRGKDTRIWANKRLFAGDCVRVVKRIGEKRQGTEWGKTRFTVNVNKVGAEVEGKGEEVRGSGAMPGWRNAGWKWKR